jgi:alpha-1,6-mannosyltransferase
MTSRRLPPTVLVLGASVAALSVLGPSRALLLPSLAAYSAAFLALLHIWHRRPHLLDDPRILLGGALVLRLVLFPSLPDLSDDLYRYVWDGWLSSSGINPFRFPPSDPALAAYQGSLLFERMNSPDFHSIYPPLSQLVFLPGGALFQAFGWPISAFAVKAGFLMLEMAGVYCLYRALRAMGRRPGALVLYAWNPLPLVVVAGGGHTEGGLVLGMGLLAWGVAGNGARRAWIGLMLAVASKGIPLLLAPLLLRRQVSEQGLPGSLWATVPAALLGIVLLAPFLFSGLLGAVASSADLYVRLFEFNAGPYFLLKEIGLLLTGEDWGKWIGPALRWLFLAAAVLIWVRHPLRHAEDWFRATLLLLALYLATATTVHPWYLLWGLPLVPFTPLLRGAWLWASWAAFPTYLTFVGWPHGLLAGLFWGGVAWFTVREFEGRLRDPLLRWAGRRKARQVTPHLEGKTILDLGAGEGYVAHALRRADRTLFLMDVGPYVRVPLPTVVYDGREIPLSDGSVDTVLLSLALHHAEDPDRVVEEALRVARRRVVVTESTYVWGWERRVLATVDGWANRTRGMSEGTGTTPSLQFRTVPQWEAAFARQGGRVIRSERLNRIGHRHHLFVLVPEPGALRVGDGVEGEDQPEEGSG